MEKNNNPLYNEAIIISSGNYYKKGDWQNIPEIQHSNSAIKGFFGEYRFLSNFGEALIQLDKLSQFGACLSGRKMVNW